MNVKKGLSNFLNSTNEYSLLVSFAAGLYPFFHFYNSNLSIADSFFQFLMLAVVCFLGPLVLVYIGKKLVILKQLSFFKTSYLSIINVSGFALLLGVIIFQFNKKQLVILFLISILVGYLIRRHLKKIVVMQLMLAAISFIVLIPKIWFALNQDNDKWSRIPREMLEVKVLTKPNIFVIQPDGYANSGDLGKSPYNFDNSEFDNWLHEHGFNLYENFRSNYYSTLTSNASMFAMKHHFYSNTNSNTLKTHNANNIIVGDKNNVLKILKNNQYTSYLITDNSYFLSNRRELYFDYLNIPDNKIPYFDARTINKVDILADFGQILDTIASNQNFFFIEKTIPSHIVHSPQHTKGAPQERRDYLTKLQDANLWLKQLIEKILKFDEDALVIIVSDHGGYVGLNYTAEVIERQLNTEETISAFSSFLSIKWPKNLNTEDLEFKTNVNLFANVFYALSQNEVFLEHLQSNTSYLPLIKNGETIYYECIDENKNVIFNPEFTPQY